MTEYQTITTPPLINAIEAFASIGVSRTRAYELLNSGAVTAVKLGAKTMIRTADWQRYIADLPAYRPANMGAA